MITNVGIDIVEISRIANAMRTDRFTERILAPEEHQPPMNAAFVAGRWAAKEAIAKAVSTEIHWHDVVIITQDDGRPLVEFRKPGILKPGQTVHVSISHERSMAVAVAILETL